MENIKEEFEKRNNTRDWFVEGGRVDGDTPEGYVYEDFTTDMCWTCFFDAYNTQRLRADTAEAERDALKDEVGQVKGEYDRAVNKVTAAERRIADLEGREVLAEAEGILTFMRSDSDGCGCCDGQHVFCRYFEGVRSFDDFSQNTRFRNDLEGRRFRISIELIPDAALNPNPEAESHGS